MNRKGAWASFFRGVDRVLRRVEWMFPKSGREKALQKAVAWVTERLNGEDGLGAIYPAMANSVMMFDCLGYPPDHPDRAIAMKSVEKLMVVEEDRAYCQPCLSPIWDTGLASHALAGGGRRCRGAAEAVGAVDARTPGAGRGRGLGVGATGCATGRLGVPVQQRTLSGCR